MPPDQLTDAEERRVGELIAALRTNVDIRVNPASSLMTGVFCEEFTSRLLAQHIFMGSILFQESFDAAFCGAARIAGLLVNPAPDGQRFWDVTVDGKKLSLKSSKAKGMRLDLLHISKLTEAAWIQDCRSAKQRHEFTVSLFTEYLRVVSSIYQLRYFESTATYELVEIPSSLLAPILELPVQEFNADGPSIGIPIGQRPANLTLKLDRSDAKITLANLRKSLCTVHATWTLPS